MSFGAGAGVGDADKSVVVLAGLRVDEHVMERDVDHSAIIKITWIEVPPLRAMLAMLPWRLNMPSDAAR